MKTLIIELQEKIMDSSYPMQQTKSLWIELNNMLSIIDEHPNETPNIKENKEVKRVCDNCQHNLCESEILDNICYCCCYPIQTD